ncbi:unnamed protein product, partial [Iphiclides podalirius]
MRWDVWNYRHYRKWVVIEIATGNGKRKRKRKRTRSKRDSNRARGSRSAVGLRAASRGLSNTICVEIVKIWVDGGRPGYVECGAAKPLQLGGLVARGASADRAWPPLPTPAGVGSYMIGAEYYEQP